MLIWFVVLYLLFSIGIGIYASTRVHNSRDFVVAGRNLPLPVVTATVFATWFGAETVLGISATFVKEGLSGVVADPFGASLCLVIAGLFFAPLLYRMNLLTIGDYYRARYNRVVELIMTICIMISYLGWVSAQVTALGLVFNMVSGGGVDQQTGMYIGTGIVLAYTMFGGMWSVALLDFVQMTVIMAGMLLIAVLVSGDAGGVSHVVDHAQAAGKLQLFPRGGYEEWGPFIGAGITMMLGSIPQQDVFQRMTSARNENTAVRGTLIGALVYFCFAFVPIYIAYSALVADPSLGGLFADKDARVIQRILPDLVLARMPLWAQVMFFGALLSAILSTASGALLAPAALFTENVLRPFVRHMGDRQMLLTVRIILVTFTTAALVFALNSTSTMYQMVQNAYSATLTGAFVPLAAGAYWKRANTQGALLSIVLGVGTWLVAGNVAAAALVPPNLAGFFAAIIGMVFGALAPTIIRNQGHSIEASLAHRKPLPGQPGYR